MIVIGGENPPPSQIFILGKKGGRLPKIRQKFNQLWFGSNFQGNLRPIKYCDCRWKSPPSPKPKLDFRLKRGGHPKLGKNLTNSDFAQTFMVTSSQSRILIGGKNVSIPQAKTQFETNNYGPAKIRQNSTNLDLVQTFRVSSGQFIHYSHRLINRFH